MQLSINDCDVDLDVLNDYADLLRDLFDALTNIFIVCIIQLHI